MVEIGKLNKMKVVKEVDFGLYLDGGDVESGGWGEILLAGMIRRAMRSIAS